MHQITNNENEPAQSNSYDLENLLTFQNLEHPDSVRKIFCEILSATTFSGARSAFVAIHYAGIGYFMSLCGDSSAAAASIVSPAIAFMAAITMGITSATGTNLGVALGESNREAVSEIIKTSWVVSVALGITSGAVYFLLKPILPLCLNDDIAENASKFFMTYAIAAIPEILTWNNGQIVFKVENMPFLSFLAAGMYRLPAVALSYYFGLTLKMGPIGIGLGSAVSGWLNVILSQPWFYIREIYKELNIAECAIKNFPSHLKKFWKSGWPLAFQRTSEWVNLLIIAQTTAKWSKQDLLAIQTSLLLLIGSGLIQQGVGQGAMMQVVEDRKVILKAFKGLMEFPYDLEKINLIKNKVNKNFKQFLIGNVVSIMFSLFLALAIYFYSDKIISLYAPANSANEETFHLANKLLLINCLSLPFDASRNVTAGILRGWNDLLFPTVVSLMCMTVIAMPIGVGMGEKYSKSLIPVFLARLIGLIFAAGVNIFRFMEHSKQDKVLAKIALNCVSQDELVHDKDANSLLLSLVKAAKNDAEATAFATVLIKEGAKPISKDAAWTSRDWTVLHWAAYRGYSQCLAVILSSYDDFSELMHVISQKTSTTFRCLVKGNQTPFDVAKQYSQAAICELLDGYANQASTNSISATRSI